MTLPMLAVPEGYEELEFRSVSWPDRARAFTVVDAAAYAKAGETLTEIKALRSEIAAACDPVIDATNQSHKAAVAQKRTLEGPLVEAEGIIKASMVRWYDEDARRRREEQVQREKEARAAEDAARLEEAAHLEAHGESEQAELVLTAPSIVPPPAPVEAPKVEGVSVRETWDAVCDDVKALCRAVADGTMPATLVTPNLTALRQMAKALKGEFRVPGCRAVSTRGIAAGKAR